MPRRATCASRSRPSQPHPVHSFPPPTINNQRSTIDTLDCPSHSIEYPEELSIVPWDFESQRQRPRRSESTVVISASSCPLPSLQLLRLHCLRWTGTQVHETTHPWLPQLLPPLSSVIPSLDPLTTLELDPTSTHPQMLAGARPDRRPPSFSCMSVHTDLTLTASEVVVIPRSS